MNLTKVLNNRYSTKAFDPNKKISDEDFEQLKSLLRMSPSSTNLQPWHFIIAATDAGKARMAKGVQGSLKFNEPKIVNASHVVLFCSKTTADEAYKKHIADTEDKDGRFPNEEIKQMMENGRNLFVNIHKNELSDLQHWLEKQVYLNIGQFLLGAATLGIDACPMEGIDVKAMNEEFGLEEQQLTAIVAVTLGYRLETDFNIPAKTPKSRLPFEEILTII
jgi:dihydropteridine reductase (EC 1.5.1.34)